MTYEDLALLMPTPYCAHPYRVYAIHWQGDRSFIVPIVNLIGLD